MRHQNMGTQREVHGRIVACRTKFTAKFSPPHCRLHHLRTVNSVNDLSGAQRQNRIRAVHATPVKAGAAHALVEEYRPAASTRSQRTASSSRRGGLTLPGIPMRSGGSKARIAVIPGDGIGAEVAPQAVKVFQTVCATANRAIEFVEFDLGADRD